MEKGNVEIVYCPTSNMIGDFFTKPLQGKKFEYFRDLILGKKSVSSMDIDARSVLDNGDSNGEYTTDKGQTDSAATNNKNNKQQHAHY